MKDCVILLKDLLESGICVEEESAFEKSIFSDVYENAAVSVENIVQMNWKNRKSQTIKLSHQEQEIANVVSFIGRRGTGKTSSMLSFRRALDRYKYKDKDRFQEDSGLKFSPEADMENVRFFCLDYIDASILEESEDVFILVLAGMLNCLDSIEETGKEEHSYDYRWLLQKMENVYKDFITIKNSAPYENDEYTSYERLRNIASSQRIRALFQELVQQFLEYLQSRSNAKHGECYLVITLDDLDMAHYNIQMGQKQGANNKSFEIVNCIYKYLSIPGVIVLAAYNHENLMQQCMGFFGNCDRNPFYEVKEKDEELKRSSSLSNQFMDKAFPAGYRLYMPSWRKRDYAEEHFLVNIKEGMPDNFALKKYCDNHREVVSVKDLLLILYAEEIGVYYDFEGKKKHFLEPDSLRSLKDTLALFGDMSSTAETGEESRSLRKREDIFKAIKADLHFHFIQSKLYLLKERELFGEWMELRIDRRSEEIVRLMCKDTIPLSKEIKKTIQYYEAEIRAKIYAIGSESAFDYFTEEDLKYFMDNENVKYSFAELVHSIFHMTRDEKGIETVRYSKELVACVLHSYTIYLSQLYDAYREEKSKLDKDAYVSQYRYSDKNDRNEILAQDVADSFRKVEHNYDILKGVIGDTICGRWTEYFFPEVYFDLQPDRYDSMEPVNIGYVSDVEFSYRADFIHGEAEMKKYLREIIFVSMLHTDVLQWNHITCRCKILKDQAVTIQFSRRHRDDIELTAFMKYAFLYQDFLKKMEELLTEAVKNAEVEGEKEGKFKHDLKVCIRDFFSELWNEFYENDHKNGNMMFPIHNFDYAYNLIKHLYMETKDRNDPVKISNGGDFFDEFWRMVLLFANHLKELDQFYCIVQRERNFNTIFLDNPCITLFKKLKGDEKSVERIGKFIVYNVIIEKANRRNMRVSPDEWN